MKYIMTVQVTGDVVLTIDSIEQEIVDRYPEILNNPDCVITTTDKKTGKVYHMPVRNILFVTFEEQKYASKQNIIRLTHAVEAQLQILRGFRRRDFSNDAIYETAVIDRIAQLTQAKIRKSKA